MSELIGPTVAILFVFAYLLWSHVEVDGFILSRAGIAWIGAKRKKEREKQN
jgi:hypothetical protein